LNIELLRNTQLNQNVPRFEGTLSVKQARCINTEILQHNCIGIMSDKATDVYAMSIAAMQGSVKKLCPRTVMEGQAKLLLTGQRSFLPLTN
jgi:hypothetical protein